MNTTPEQSSLSNYPKPFHDRPVLVQCVLFLLPVLFLFPFLGGFIYARGSDFNDLAISHYPNAIWIQQSIQRWGEVPLWSETILSGYPFSANPLAGLFYFPGWFGLIFPLPFGLNLMISLHLIWGGIGMYLFLRSEGLTRWPAMLGALGFESMSKLFAHIGSGHLTLIYAVVWTPWLLIAQKKASTAPQKYRFLPALILGLVLLADVRWILPAGLLWAAYGLKLSGNSDLADAPVGAPEGAPASKTKRLLNWGLSSGANAVLALGLSAVLLLPLAEYTSLSTRSSMSVEDVLTLSMPWGQLFGLLVPDIGGFAEWMIYPGSMILIFCLLGLGMRQARHKSAFWWCAALVGIVYALGENVPGLRMLAGLPGFNLVRVPSRGLFISIMALSVIGSITLQYMVDHPDWGMRRLRFDPLKVLAGLAFFVILLIPFVWTATKQVPLRFIWGGAGLGAGLTLVFLSKNKKVSNQLLPVLAMAFLLVDLGGVNFLGLDFRTQQDVLGKGSQVLALIEGQPNPSTYRLYSPSYSVPQQTAAAHAMELADGVDPLQLAAYSEFMQTATGVPIEGYSVTIPPYKDGEIATANQAYQPDPKALGLINVLYLTSEFPLQDAALTPIGKVDQTFVYKNEDMMPRAWVQSDSGSNLDALVTKKSANSIELTADGPGLLVVSEVNYPGWKAWVDGKPVEIVMVDGILRGVELGSGAHQIKMAYQPIPVFVGGGISLMLWLIAAGLFLLRMIKGNPKGGYPG